MFFILTVGARAAAALVYHEILRLSGAAYASILTSGVITFRSNLSVKWAEPQAPLRLTFVVMLRESRLNLAGILFVRR